MHPDLISPTCARIIRRILDSPLGWACIAAFVLSAPCLGAQIDDVLAAGHRLQESGDFEKAAVQYNFAIKIAPNKPDGYCGVGDCLQCMGKPKEALEHFNAALKLDPANSWAQWSKCHHYFFLHDYRTMLNTADAWIKLNPRGAGAYDMRATALMELKRYDEALKSFHRAIDLDNLAEYHVTLGECLKRVRRTDEAFHEFAVALSISKKSEEAYDEICGMLMDKQNNLAALKYANLYIQQAPKSPRAHYKKGLILANLKRYSEALAEFSKASELDPRNGDYPFHRAVVYTAMLDDDRAMQEMNHAVELGCPDPSVYIQRSHLFSERGEYDKALADLKIWQARQPWNPSAYADMARVYVEMRKYPEAIEAYSKAIELYPGDHISLCRRAGCHLKLGEYRKAADDYGRAAAAAGGKRHGAYSTSSAVDRAIKNIGPSGAPDSAEYSVQQARMLSLAGEHDQAIRLLIKMTKTYPSSSLPLADLAAAYKRAGEWQKAKDVFTQLIAIDPSGPEWYRGRAEAYTKLGQMDAANKDRQHAHKADQDQLDFIMTKSSASRLKQH